MDAFSVLVTGVPVVLVELAPLEIVALSAVIFTDDTEAPRAFVTVQVAFAVERLATRFPFKPPLLAEIAPHDTVGLIADVLIETVTELVLLATSDV